MPSPKLNIPLIKKKPGHASACSYGGAYLAGLLCGAVEILCLPGGFISWSWGDIMPTWQVHYVEPWRYYAYLAGLLCGAVEILSRSREGKLTNTSSKTKFLYKRYKY